MYYTSTDQQTLEDYNDKVVEGEGYDGVHSIRWADVIEHQDGTQFAIKKHSSYLIIDELDEEGNPLDEPTVDSLEDFYPPLEELPTD